MVPNAHFIPAVRDKRWDGKIRLLNVSTGKLYLGLHTYVKTYCEENGYECVYEDALDVEHPFSVEEFKRMASALKLSAMNDGIREPIEPHDFQQQAVIHAIQSGRSLLLSPTACHPKGTKVLMFDGSEKCVEDVQVGDLLMGPDSTARTVLSLHTGFDEMYQVLPKDGSASFGVNKHHILSLKRTNDGTSKAGAICNLSVNQYLKRSKTFRHTHKLYRSQCITFSPCDNIEFPIEPYFLGILLGGGSLTGSGVGVTTIDQPIIDEVYRQATIFGLTVRPAPKTETKAISYYFRGRHHTTLDNWLLMHLRTLGLYPIACESRFIPKPYRLASVEQRLQLLAGLMDTDGSLSNGTAYDFTSKSETLTTDVAFVARSLGFYVCPTITKVVAGTPYYRIFISGDVERIPVRLSYKKKLTSTRKDPLVTGFDLLSIGMGEYFGFSLDGDRLYLLDDFTVTHNSGKSLMIYLLLRYYLARTKGKLLVIVPNTALVKQLFDDFVDYSAQIQWDADEHCHLLYDGGDKQTDKRIVISTWQALAVKESIPTSLKAKLTKKQAQTWRKTAPYVLGQEYFDQFSAVFGDEAHQYAADECTNIMSKLSAAKYRFGTTGTLRDSKTNQMVLEGLFGQVYQTVTTKELMDRKKVAQLTIKCLQLQYTDEERKKMRKKPYPEEMEFLQSHRGRNMFIRNLALSLEGNTLVLFEKVEKHGKILHQLIEERVKPGRKLFYAHGKTKTDDRNEIRKVAEGETDAIIVASYGTFSTGINIRNIDNIIFASPTKSKVRVLQSVGRGLRLSRRKSKVTLYDIADDMSVWNKNGTDVWDNYSLQHFTERVEFYNNEQFDYKMYKIQIQAA
jgi:superfamily II DNA or RNA helicase